MTTDKQHKEALLKILEGKDKERKAEIKRIKQLKNIAEWERKMMLKAVRSSVWGW